jgi:Rrf2 family protein
MAHISRGVEYALHCMLFLSDQQEVNAPSAHELAEFQGVPSAFVAKLFTKLVKAGLVRSATGARGGYTLARPANAITILQVVEAIDGTQPLFQCTEVRRNCVLFTGSPPAFATRGTCGINQVMRDADAAMREFLAGRTLADIGSAVAGKIPVRHIEEGRSWFEQRALERATRGRSAD